MKYYTSANRLPGLDALIDTTCKCNDSLVIHCIEDKLSDIFETACSILDIPIDKVSAYRALSLFSMGVYAEGA